MDLFTCEIDGYDSWARIFQSAEAFSPLAEHIYGRHGVRFDKLENLTAGTNAVFKMNDTVIKIFAPMESGFSCGSDHIIELAGVNHAVSCGVETPKGLFSGTMEDRYSFPYIIFEYIKGYDFTDIAGGLSEMDKVRFARNVKNMTARLNIPYTKGDIPDNISNNILTNHRYEKLSPQLKEEIFLNLRSVKKNEYVYVHGDINSGNIIVGDNLKIYLIDFADSHIAPKYYEYAPIVFDLFKFDKVMMYAYFGEYRTREFASVLTSALALHDFGGDFIVNLCKISGVSPSDPKSLAETEDLIYRFILDF